MKKTIEALLIQLEKENNFQVLFAVENGSRAWGMESKDSDYDVRFVFYRPIEKYITLDKPQDVINAAYDKDLNPHTAHGSYIDMSGFDVFKYLKLLATSNPTAIEWLNSPIVYRGNNNIELKDYVNQNFNPEKLFYHYFSLFEKTYNRYIKNGEELTYKKYLYCLRGLLNALFVLKYDKIPPLKMRETVKNMEKFIPDDIINMTNRVIEIKSSGLEKGHISAIKCFDHFFEEHLNMKPENISKRRLDRQPFDKFLQKCLGIIE